MKSRNAAATLLVLAALVAPVSADDRYTVFRELVILHTNDLHSHLEGFGPDADYTPGTPNDDATRGGFARLSALVARERAEATSPRTGVLLLDAGDFTMGSLFHLLEPTHAPELTLMAEMGFDATTLGNHEFDWGPGPTAAIVATGAGSVPILATNLVAPAADPRSAPLAALLQKGLVRRWMVKTLPNGLRVGMFGLMGRSAALVVPQAAPVTFADPFAAAQEAVAALRAEDVDLIVAISHSGVGNPAAVPPILGEDEALAHTVPGIDVIVSGHSHTHLPAPLVVTRADGSRTVIVQAGEYGQWLGRLTLRVFNTKPPEVAGYESIAVDDTTAGDPGVTNEVEAYRHLVDFAISPLGTRQVLAETAFPVGRPPYVVAGEVPSESAIGNLVTDAMRAVASASTVPLGARPVDFAFESSTQVRDPIVPGKTGLVRVSDAFRAFPLGAGPDGLPGYPVTTFFLTAADVKQVLEVSATLGMLAGEDFFLQVSGLRFAWNPAGFPFARVSSVEAGDELHGYSPFDTSAANTALYRVAANYFLSSFIAQLGPLTGGAVTIVPKDEAGYPVADLAARIVDRDPLTAGLQELKEWQALVAYLGGLPDSDGDPIPNVPILYAAPLGRIRTAAGAAADGDCARGEAVRD